MPFEKQNHLREFVNTHVNLTPDALVVGCEPQFVLHFAGIAEISVVPERCVLKKKNWCLGVWVI